MKKIKIGKLLIGVGFMCTLIVLGVIFLNQPNKNSYMDKLNNMKTYSSASFFYSAETIDELTDLSDIIIEGKTVDYNPKFSDGLVYTYETVEVKKVLKGNVTEGDKVTVVFTGGQLNENVTPPIKDCPIMDFRGNYMLFLKTNDGKNYFIIGGNNGFGLIKDNKIQTTDKSSLGDAIKSYNVDKLDKYIKNNNVN